MRRLERARIPAAQARRELTGQVKFLDKHLEYLADVAARFERRRDHLLAAVQAQPQDSEPAAELAGTAAALLADVEKARTEVAEARAAVKERHRGAAGIVAKIDAAAARLTEALAGLEQVRLEKENEARLRDLKRGYRERLQTLDQQAPDLAPAGLSPIPASVTWDLEGRVRDATRLTYEAEALAELRRDELK